MRKFSIRLHMHNTLYIRVTHLRRFACAFVTRQSARQCLPILHVLVLHVLHEHVSSVCLPKLHVLVLHVLYVHVCPVCLPKLHVLVLHVLYVHVCPVCLPKLHVLVLHVLYVCPVCLPKLHELIYMFNMCMYVRFAYQNNMC